MRSADALIVNGAGFEEGLLDVIEGAEIDGGRGVRGDRCRHADCVG